MGNRIAVIGGSAAGLSCAATLGGAGLAVDLFEGRDRLGGQMVTDQVEGFTLDHGFQVVLTGYPNIRDLLDLRGLDLRYFSPGTLIFDGKDTQWLMDPLVGSRQAVLETLKSRIPTWSDKLQLSRMKLHLTRSTVRDLIGGPVETTRQVLRHRWGFSDRFIASFFEPFLGTFLADRSLSARSAVSLMAMRSFFKGRMGIPAKGIQGITNQLADQVPNIHRNEPITDLRALQAQYDVVVIATGAGGAIELLSQIDARLPGLTSRVHRATTLYFAARQAPISHPVVLTNGAPHHYVSTLAVPSRIAPYAPTGWHLVALNLLGEAAHQPIETVLAPALGEARLMVGEQADDWRFLRGYQTTRPDTSVMGSAEVTINDRLYVCGDHREVGGLEAALYSGQQVADQIIAHVAR